MTRHGSHTESRMRENCTYGSMSGNRLKPDWSRDNLAISQKACPQPSVRCARRRAERNSPFSAPPFWQSSCPSRVLVFPLLATVRILVILKPLMPVVWYNGIVCIIFLSELGVFKKGYDSKSRLKSRPDVQSGRGFRRSSFRIPPKRRKWYNTLSNRGRCA